MLRFRKNKFGLVALSFTCVFLAGIIRINNANAVDWDTIKAKAVFEGVHRCASMEAYASEWDVATSSKETGFITNGELDVVSLPYALTGVDDNLISCKEVMVGLSSWASGELLSRGLLPVWLSESPDNMSTMRFYAGDSLDGDGGIGYKAKEETVGDTIVRQTLQITRDSSDNSGKYAQLYLKKKATSKWAPVPNNTLVFPRVVDGLFMSNDEEANIANEDYIGLCASDASDAIDCNVISIVRDTAGKYYQFQQVNTSSGNILGVTCSIAAIAENTSCGTPFQTSSGWYGIGTVGSMKTEGISGGGTALELAEDYKNKMIVGLNEKNEIGYKVPNLKNYDSLALSTQEIYDLYTYYLADSNIFDAVIICEGDPDYSDSGKLVNWAKNKQCRVVDNSWKKPTQKVYGVYIGEEDEMYNHFSANELTIQDIIDKLNQLTIDNIETRTTSTYIPETPQPGGKPEKQEGTCMSAGGGGALSWILCPALELLSGAAQDVWEKSVSPALRIEPQLFSKNEDVGTRKAWGVFQGIANTFFVILLLFVIFSQLTGVGIDNYGIKKILPKLIIAAVLINLSYWICLIMVDLSNIVGNGLQALFSGLPTGNNPSYDVYFGDVPVNTSTASDSGLFGVGLLVALVGGIFLKVVFSNPAVLLSLLVSALGIAIAIFFLFVLLSAREAGVVVLTVISPLAFACNMLPNTKKLFDKWVKLGQGLLLVYPICGLMVGGGDYVSRLLMTASLNAGGNFMRAFMAMIVGIVPIFFIPSVLKGSFAAMGKVGGMLTGIGRQARGAATGRIRKSEGYKAAQVRGYARKTRIKAGLDKNYKPTTIGNIKAGVARSKIGKALGYEGLQRARIASARKEQASRLEGDVMLGAMQMEYDQSKNPRRTEDYLRERLEAVADSKNDDAKFSVIDQMIKAGVQGSHIAQITRDVFGQKAQDKNFLEKFANKYGGSFLKKDFEQLDWARKGGLDGAGNAQALFGGANGSWATSTYTDPRTSVTRRNMAMDDMKDEDVAALSSDRLHELIAAGLISQSQAQRIWASNANMDDTNRLIMGAYGNAGMNISKSDAQRALAGVYANTASGLTDDMRRAYTERAATDTRITDVEWKNRYGEHQQTDDLYVNHRETARIGQADGREHIYERNQDGSWQDASGNKFTSEQFARIQRRLEQQRQQGQQQPPRRPRK